MVNTILKNKFTMNCQEFDKPMLYSKLSYNKISNVFGIAFILHGNV
jgi:hypothetical protein